MIKLRKSITNYEALIDICIKGIGEHSGIKTKVENSKSALVSCGEIYEQLASDERLFTLSPYVCESTTFGTLTKADLIKLYENYFVPTIKPARIFYEKILNSAQDSCPFCGGIGSPNNVDHFLPKARFPQFSVFPGNLVPICRDCNSGSKKEFFGQVQSDQLIHPYFDNDCFFDEQWIFADFFEGDSGEPGVFRYKTIFPEAWQPCQKERAQNYFELFGLSKRYSIQASTHLKVLLTQVQRLLNRGLDVQEVIDDLIHPGIESAPFKNHWQVGMFQSLAIHLRAVGV